MTNQTTNQLNDNLNDFCDFLNLKGMIRSNAIEYMQQKVISQSETRQQLIERNYLEKTLNVDTFEGEVYFKYGRRQKPSVIGTIALKYAMFLLDKNLSEKDSLLKMYEDKIKSDMEYAKAFKHKHGIKLKSGKIY